MNMLDIIGPAMVGPSSSHTAGAVRIGRIARKLMAEKIISAKILLHGSFLATGKGHGTDKKAIEMNNRRIENSAMIGEN